MMFRSFDDLLSGEIRGCISSTVDKLRSWFSSTLTVTIKEKDGDFTLNEVYAASKTYLSTKIPPSASHLQVTKHEDDRSIAVSLHPGEPILDVFQGIPFQWELFIREIQNSSPFPSFHNGHHRAPPMVVEERSLLLTFNKKHKDIALTNYLPYVLERAKAIKDEDKTLKLHVNDGNVWSPVPFRHPATFDTLAMDPQEKRVLMEDLAIFIKRKDYYKRIGKAWKRGYLLYGPPGTGKSSLIAAMANYLRFDVYDLELTEVYYNSDLRKMLAATGNRSILVIEDIDCSLEMKNRESEEEKEEKSTEKKSEDNKSEVTLSGLLNFIDGLWSSCGEERIIVFTTNYKEKLDPALLRPGRMDKHIHLGYCSFEKFKVLASNYHDLDDHQSRC